VGGIDRDRLTRGAVADEVHEVDHLARQRVVRGDVPTSEQLAEVEAVVHGSRIRTVPPLSDSSGTTRAARRGTRRRTGRSPVAGRGPAIPQAPVRPAGADRPGSGAAPQLT